MYYCEVLGYMEEFKISKIDTNVTFVHLQFSSAEQMIQYRRGNMAITQMLWIKKRAVCDCLGEPYNPTALIVVTLN